MADPQKTIPAWSFSRLVDFEKCPQMAYRKYALKQPEPATVDKTAANRGQMVHTAAEEFVKKDGPLIPELAKVKEQLLTIKEAYSAGKASIEEDWAFDVDWQTTGWFDPNVWLRVKLDAGIQHDPTTYEVIDYKTGKRFGNEVKHAQQGLLYGIAAILRLPEIETVKVNFLYTDEKASPKPKELKREAIARMIPTWHDRALRMTTATEFPPKPNKINCAFCPYSGNRGGDKSCPSRVDV